VSLFDEHGREIWAKGVPAVDRSRVRQTPGPLPASLAPGVTANHYLIDGGSGKSLGHKPPRCALVSMALRDQRTRIDEGPASRLPWLLSTSFTGPVEPSLLSHVIP